MVEEKIEPVVLAGDFEGNLAADEGEAGSEFEEEFLDVLDEAGFEFALTGVLGQREEIEVVGIFQELLGQVGLRSG